MPSPFQPHAPSRGDAAPAAATAGAKQAASVSVVGVPYASPAAVDPDGPLIGTAGDLVFQSPSTLTGGTELTIVPTEKPELAYRAFKLSPLLSPVIDAFVANVYAVGYAIDPILQPDNPHSKAVVKRALKYMQAWRQGSYEYEAEISDEEVELELKRIRTRIGNEIEFLSAWFSRAVPGSSYLQLCALTGQDLEIQGDAYWEVLRDEHGRPAKLVWTPAWSIRAKQLDPYMLSVETPVRLSSLHWGTEMQARRFRSYVQQDLNGTIIARYKEYGDPRCLSRRTGKYYSSFEALQANKDEWLTDAAHNDYPPLPATELLHFELPNPLSTTYGKPGYTGVYPVLEGTRDLAEENQHLITDRRVPQMFICIAGGVGVAQEDIDRLQEQIEQNAKQGRRSIYFIQARSDRTEMGRVSPTPTVHFEKTKSEQYQDALGLQYHKHCEEQLEHAYRLPAAALGRHGNLSEGTIQSGYRYAEAQAYDPRRSLFADRINTTLLPDLGIQLTRYKAQARTPKEPNELANIIRVLMDGGVLTPDEGRQLASDIFNRDFQDLEGIWSKLPTKLLLAMLQTKNQLVAAALLGSESESDIIAHLQAALVGQLENTGLEVQTNGRGNTEEDSAGVPSESSGGDAAGGGGEVPL